MLYRDLEFSIFRVDSIAEAMRRNRSFAGRCRTLSITLKGSPRPRHTGAYFTQSDAFADGPAYATREKILTDLTYVLDQCSVHGSIHHFSWDLTSNTSLAFDWLMKAFKSWRSFISLGRTLRTLRYSVRKERTSFDDTGLLSSHLLPNIAKLVLNISMEGSEVATLRRLLTCTPNIRNLDIDVSVPGWDFRWHEAGADGFLLPNAVFKQLKSLSLTTNAKVAEVCPDDYIARQPSLIELKDCYTSLIERRLIGISSTLRGLYTNRPLLFTEPTPMDIFHDISIFRSSTPLLSLSFLEILSRLTQLKCIEMSVSVTNSFKGDEAACRKLSQYASEHHDIIEVGVLIELERIPEDISKKALTSTKRLDVLLSLCSTVRTIRAFRLAYTMPHFEGADSKGKLPKRHTLVAAEIPQELEYVLWEVPWAKRLYKIERSETDVKMIYTGLDRLPGRVVHDNLSWTNESVFDHMIRDSDALEIRGM